jgi:CCCH-type zinc finger/Zinc finger C-x8-C-x5-C-x3-H type (and similar)
MNQAYQDILKKESKRNFQNIFSLEATKDISMFKSEPEAKIKTEICRNWETGSCEYGEKCFFAHGLKELREKSGLKLQKVQKCENYFKFGYCINGSKCLFKHSGDGLETSSTVLSNQKKSPNQLQQEKFNAPLFIDLENRNLYRF